MRPEPEKKRRALRWIWILLVIMWEEAVELVCGLVGAARKLREWGVEVYASAVLWWIGIILRAHAKGVSPLTILCCWTLKTLSWCANFAALLILTLCSASGTTPLNAYFWVAAACAVKPFLITTLITLAKRCGAQTVKVCHPRAARTQGGHAAGGHGGWDKQSL